MVDLLYHRWWICQSKRGGSANHRVADPPDSIFGDLEQCVVAIIDDQQRTVFDANNPDGAARGVVIGFAPASQNLGGRPVGFTVGIDRETHDSMPGVSVPVVADDQLVVPIRHSERCAVRWQ
jgi:hypothetical protein